MNPDFLGITAVGWQGLGVMGTAAAVVVALTVGWRQLAAARKLRLEQARPYVIVDFQPGQGAEKLLDLVITNIGKSPAYDLRIAFDPAPVRAKEIAKFPLKDARILNEPTPMFAPGREFRMFFDNAVDRYQTDLPMNFQVTTTYRDSRKKKYKETFTIDFDSYRGAAYTVVHGVHDAVKHLKAISDTLKRSAIAGGPVEVVHERRDDYDNRLTNEAAEQRAAYDELVARMRPTDEDTEK